jgi:hypothetical protein
MKLNSPQLGFNNNVRHKGRVFHIQTEDSGVKHPHIITHLFADGGRILKTTKTSYAEFLEDGELAKKVRGLMQEQHKAMFIALRAGKFDAVIGDVPLAEGAPKSEAGPASTAVPLPDSSAAKPEGAAESTRENSLAGAAAFASAPTNVPIRTGEALRLPTIPSSLDLEAAAAQGLAIAGVPAAAVQAAAPSSPGTSEPRAPDSAPREPPPSSKPGTSGTALARFAEKQGPPPSAPFRTMLGRASSSDLSSPASQAKAAAVSPVTQKPQTGTKLEPPRARAASVPPPPPARPPAEPPRTRPQGPQPLHPPSVPGQPATAAPNRPPPRAPMQASLDLDIGALERAAEQSQAPVYKQVRDLPPPPAALLKPARENTSYRSVTPQPAQIVSQRPPASREGPATPPGGNRPVERQPPDQRKLTPGAGRYAPSRPASIFGSARPQEGSSIFGEDLISEKSLDEVILSYLAEDLEGPQKK